METATLPSTTSRISTGLAIPVRSRSFTPSEVKTVLTALQEGQNVGYGVFNTQGAARSAGMTLNKLLIQAGAEHKYSTTVYQLDSLEDGTEQWQGAIKPQVAKAAPTPAAKKNGKRK